jgi:uncharacterized phage protein gp47/JayE
MPLQTQDFDTLVQNQVASVQANSNLVLDDFIPGSILLALIEANTAAVALWLQGLADYDLSLTRAATSDGSDLDSWMADFGFTRTPATYATGVVTFSRVNANMQAVVPFNTQLQTTNAIATFSVTIDTTNANYNSLLGGYVLAVNTTSINVPVQANQPGTGGNVASNSITIITTPIAFVDSVTNSSSFTNASNAETDAAFRAGFILYLGSLSKATLSAVEYAIQSVPGVQSYTVNDNVAYGGGTQYGYFYVVIDDGTGDPSSQLLSNVNNAIEAVRGLTITYGVFACTVTTINVVMTVTVATGYSHSTIAPIVQAALESYINSLSVGANVYYTRLIQVAYDCTPGIQDITGYTLNSGTSDITIGVNYVAKYGTVTIS